MSLGLATRGYLTDEATAGGGGGGGPGGGTARVYFEVLDDNNEGVEEIDFGAGEIKVSIGGAAYDDAIGTVEEIGLGSYYYEFDTDEIPSTPGTNLVHVAPAGYAAKTYEKAFGQTNEEQTTTLQTNITAVLALVSTLPSSSQVATAVLTTFREWEHDENRTWEGLQVRIDAVLAGISNGLTVLGSKAFMRSDGVTAAIEATLDPATGERTAVSVSGSEP